MEQVKIKSIRKLPKKLDRYDLTINSTHNFFANNILIHNTSFICGNVLTKRYPDESFIKKSVRGIRNFIRRIMSSIDHKKRQIILSDFVIEYGEVT